MTLRAVICLVLSAPPLLLAHPYGAPCSVMTDISMAPQHGARPQSTPSPFKIVVLDEKTGAMAKDTIETGARYKVIIDHGAKASIKGFIIRAIEADVKRPDAGEFVGLPDCVRLVKLCTVGGHYVTHRKPFGTPGGCKPGPLTLKWEAPATTDPGVRVYFQATVVQDYKTFWTNIITPSFKLLPQATNFAQLLQLVGRAGPAAKTSPATTAKPQAKPTPKSQPKPKSPPKPDSKPTPPPTTTLKPTTTTTLPKVTTPKFDAKCGVEDGPDCLFRYQRDLKRSFCGIEGWPDYCPQLCCGYVNSTSAE